MVELQRRSALGVKALPSRKELLARRACSATALCVVVFLVAACASKLKESSEIVAAPEALQQSFETVAIGEITSEVPGKPVNIETPSAAVSRARPVEVRTKTSTRSKKETKVLPKAKTWTTAEWPFGIGERLVYRLGWGIVDAGNMTLQVLEPKVLDGERVLHYSAALESSSVLDLIYKVNDTMESWVTMDSHLPRRQEIRTNESGQWGRRVVVFSPNSKDVRFYSHNTKKNGQVSITDRVDPRSPEAQDIFGALYFFRFVPDLKALHFPIHDRFRDWNCELEYQGEETLQTKAGSFLTERYKLYPRISGQLEPKGDVEIWVAKDVSRKLVRFEAKIKLGSVHGQLVSVQAGVPIRVPPPRFLTPTRLSATHSR